MSSETDYKILDILELEAVSNRLRNAVKLAYQLGNMPCDTVLEYSQSKETVIEHLHKLPNIGKKTINELISLLDKYSQSLPRENPPAYNQIHIPEALKRVRLDTFIRSINCSVRLENALTGAVERHEIRIETLGELDGASVQVLKSELHRAQNLGRKSVEEFLNILKKISPHSTESSDFQTDYQASINLQANTIDWVSDYISLLEKERYDDITVSEIVRKTPACSKSEGKLLNKINQKYNDTPFYEVLASSSGELDKISRKIIKDEKLSTQLASLIMDFYWFLSSKNNQSFSYEVYFSNDFSVLNEKESQVLLSRFGSDKLTLDELGKKFGVTRERVRQIESKALAKYLKVNRVGLLHLSESLQKYIQESNGVLSTGMVKSFYGISNKKLEILLNFIIPENNESRIVRDKEYLISSDFRKCEKRIFEKIEDSIYRQTGYGKKVTIQSLEGYRRQVLDYFLFVNSKKFSINSHGDIEIITSSASERARIVLSIAGHPIHTSEAKRLYRNIFKEEITEHALGSTLGRLPDGLIVGSGTYGLYSHLRLTSEDIDSIRSEAYELVTGAGRYMSSRIIFKHILRERPELRVKEQYFNYHLILGVLQEDERFQSKRGFMVGLTSFGDHVPLETEVEELVEKHGPVSISQVIELLKPTRGELTNGSVRNTLVASNEIYLTYEKRKWDIADRVFREDSDIRYLQIAIRLAAYREKVSLSSVYNRIRSTGINYGIGTILSVIWKDTETKLDGDYIAFFGADDELENYYAKGEPTRLSQLDYRNYTEDRSIDTGVLDELVKEFDLHV